MPKILHWWAICLVLLSGLPVLSDGLSAHVGEVLSKGTLFFEMSSPATESYELTIGSLFGSTLDVGGPGATFGSPGRKDGMVSGHTDGTDKFILAGQRGIPSAGSFSFAVWVKLDGGNDLSVGSILTYGSQSEVNGKNEFAIEQDANGLLILANRWGGSGDRRSAPSTLTLASVIGQWIHVGVSRPDGGSPIFYLNGVQLGSTWVPGVLYLQITLNLNSELLIGSKLAASFQSVGIWNDVLDSTDFRLLYQRVPCTNNGYAYRPIEANKCNCQDGEFGPLYSSCIKCPSGTFSFANDPGCSSCLNLPHRNLAIHAASYAFLPAEDPTYPAANCINPWVSSIDGCANQASSTDTGAPEPGTGRYLLDLGRQVALDEIRITVPSFLNTLQRSAINGFKIYISSSSIGSAEPQSNNLVYSDENHLQHEYSRLGTNSQIRIRSPPAISWRGQHVTIIFPLGEKIYLQQVEAWGTVFPSGCFFPLAVNVLMESVSSYSDAWTNPLNLIDGNVATAVETSSEIDIFGHPLPHWDSWITIDLANTSYVAAVKVTMENILGTYFGTDMNGAFGVLSDVPGSASRSHRSSQKIFEITSSSSSPYSLLFTAPPGQVWRGRYLTILSQPGSLGLRVLHLVDVEIFGGRISYGDVSALAGKPFDFLSIRNSPSNMFQLGGCRAEIASAYCDKSALKEGEALMGGDRRVDGSPALNTTILVSPHRKYRLILNSTFLCIEPATPEEYFIPPYCQSLESLPSLPGIIGTPLSPQHTSGGYGGLRPAPRPTLPPKVTVMLANSGRLGGLAIVDVNTQVVRMLYNLSSSHPMEEGVSVQLRDDGRLCARSTDITTESYNAELQACWPAVPLPSLDFLETTTLTPQRMSCVAGTSLNTCGTGPTRVGSGDDGLEGAWLDFALPNTTITFILFFLQWPMNPSWTSLPSEISNGFELWITRLDGSEQRAYSEEWKLPLIDYRNEGDVFVFLASVDNLRGTRLRLRMANSLPILFVSGFVSGTSLCASNQVKALVQDKQDFHISLQCVPCSPGGSSDGSGYSCRDFCNNIYNRIFLVDGDESCSCEAIKDFYISKHAPSTIQGHGIPREFSQFLQDSATFWSKPEVLSTPLSSLPACFSHPSFSMETGVKNEGQTYLQLTSISAQKLSWTKPGLLEYLLGSVKNNDPTIPSSVLENTYSLLASWRHQRDATIRFEQTLINLYEGVISTRKTDLEAIYLIIENACQAHLNEHKPSKSTWEKIMSVAMPVMGIALGAVTGGIGLATAPAGLAVASASLGLVQQGLDLSQKGGSLNTGADDDAYTPDPLQAMDTMTILSPDGFMRGFAKDLQAASKNGLLTPTSDNDANLLSKYSLSQYSESIVVGMQDDYDLKLQQLLNEVPRVRQRILKNYAATRIIAQIEDIPLGDIIRADSDLHRRVLLTMQFKVKWRVFLFRGGAYVSLAKIRDSQELDYAWCEPTFDVWRELFGIAFNKNFWLAQNCTFVKNLSDGPQDHDVSAGLNWNKDTGTVNDPDSAPYLVRQNSWKDGTWKPLVASFTALDFNVHEIFPPCIYKEPNNDGNQPFDSTSTNALTWELTSPVGGSASLRMQVNNYPSDLTSLNLGSVDLLANQSHSLTQNLLEDIREFFRRDIIVRVFEARMDVTNDLSGQSVGCLFVRLLVLPYFSTNTVGEYWSTQRKIQNGTVPLVTVNYHEAETQSQNLTQQLLTALQDPQSRIRQFGRLRGNLANAVIQLEESIPLQKSQDSTLLSPIAINATTTEFVRPKFQDLMQFKATLTKATSTEFKNISLSQIFENLPSQHFNVTIQCRKHESYTRISEGHIILPKVKMGNQISQNDIPLQVTISPIQGENDKESILHVALISSQMISPQSDVTTMSSNSVLLHLETLSHPLTANETLSTLVNAALIKLQALQPLTPPSVLRHQMKLGYVETRSTHVGTRMNPRISHRKYGLPIDIALSNSSLFVLDYLSQKLHIVSLSHLNQTESQDKSTKFRDSEFTISLPSISPYRIVLDSSEAYAFILDAQSSRLHRVILPQRLTNGSFTRPSLKYDHATLSTLTFPVDLAVSYNAPDWLYVVEVESLNEITPYQVGTSQLSPFEWLALPRNVTIRRVHIRTGEIATVFNVGPSPNAHRVTLDVSPAYDTDPVGTEHIHITMTNDDAVSVKLQTYSVQTSEYTKPQQMKACLTLPQPVGVLTLPSSANTFTSPLFTVQVTSNHTLNAFGWNVGDGTEWKARLNNVTEVITCERMSRSLTTAPSGERRCDLNHIEKQPCQIIDVSPMKSSVARQSTYHRLNRQQVLHNLENENSSHSSSDVASKMEAYSTLQVLLALIGLCGASITFLYYITLRKNRVQVSPMQPTGTCINIQSPTKITK